MGEINDILANYLRLNRQPSLHSQSSESQNDAFKTTDKRDFAAMSMLMGLDSIHGKGMYSSSRKESFQMKYMSEMKPDEAVVKREDHRQPFPVRVHFQELLAEKGIAWEELLDYMNNQGYNVEDTEQQLLVRAQSTLFQRDFKEYASLNKPIMNFLDKIKQVQIIGNTTEAELKNLMKTYLEDHQYQKVVEITKPLFAKFIAEMYKSYYSQDYAPSRNELLMFLKEVSKMEKFPLSYLELSTFLEWCDTLTTEIVEKTDVLQIYKRYSDLFNQLRDIIGV
jgi:hypothetical protein